MKAVLSLYMKNVLNHNEDTCTVLYHLFCTLCYFTPLIGGTLADSWLGKYRTILYLSIVYTFGNGIMSLGAIDSLNLPKEAFAITGLLFIACGMGGIKPCVAAFGGDQFKLPEQQEQLTSFFSIFYFFINTGSLMSMIISPILRKNVKCFGMDTCYPLAFGLPCILMIISIILLVSGRPWYILKDPDGNVLKKVFMCTFYALKGKLDCRRQTDQEVQVAKRSHWLEYADGQFSTEFINDVKQLHRVLILFIPASMFWALFDQQGSRWTFQATKMNGDFFGLTLKPDQMQLLNPLMILPLIVIFYKGIFPLLGKIGLLKSHLQRMTVGGVLIACAFIVAGVLQMELDKTYPDKLLPSESRVNFISNIQCSMDVEIVDSDLRTKLEPYGQSGFDKLEAEKVYEFWVAPAVSAESCRVIGHSKFKWKSKPAKTETIFVLYDDSYGLSFFESKYTEKRLKSGEGIPIIRFAFIGVDEETARDAVLKIKDAQDEVMKVWVESSSNSNDKPAFNNTESDGIPLSDMESPPFRTDPYWHMLELHIKGSKATKLGRVRPRQGGSYLYVIAKSISVTGNEDTFELREYVITAPNSIHMFWLIPQYFLLTTAEVMFSISGCEFAFNEAPAGMKSLFQAMWLFTYAVGNVVVIIFTEFRVFERQSHEFFMYSGIMVCATVAFAIVASTYTRRSDVNDAKQAVGDEDADNTGDGDAGKDDGIGAIESFDDDAEDKIVLDTASDPSLPFNSFNNLVATTLGSSTSSFDSAMRLFIRSRESNNNKIVIIDDE